MLSIWKSPGSILSYFSSPISLNARKYYIHILIVVILINNHTKCRKQTFPYSILHYLIYFTN